MLLCRVQFDVGDYDDDREVMASMTFSEYIRHLKQCGGT